MSWFQDRLALAELKIILACRIVVSYLSEAFPDADESFGREFVLAGIRTIIDYMIWYRNLPRMSREVLEVRISVRFGDCHPSDQPFSSRSAIQR